MTQIVITRTIAAPVDVVFKTIADHNEFASTIPDIVKIEVVSETKSGVGTRFRETRRMKNREATTELEVTEFIPNERIRLVSDAFGTVWDSVFTVSSADGSAILTLTMDAKPYKTLAKLTTPMMKGMIAKAIAKDMDVVKAHCEAATN